ncbi:hypothetical protein PIROE2DRAFT_9890 [Piromyces sp. E2]|nr:hypothetical protein PIROE2DRAFT_9890 [Piromyces sp. E2]|eukprot:OUM63539.1 hypothetical protein PIROE2DRAFT_9890 [Piromyces sp. E2]
MLNYIDKDIAWLPFWRCYDRKLINHFDSEKNSLNRKICQILEYYKLIIEKCIDLGINSTTTTTTTNL